MRCPECGMIYIPDCPADEKEHKKYHDKIVNGPYGHQIKSDKIVWEKDDYRITVVNYFSPVAQKKKSTRSRVYRSQRHTV